MHTSTSTSTSKEGINKPATLLFRGLPVMYISESNSPFVTRFPGVGMEQFG